MACRSGCLPRSVNGSSMFCSAVRYGSRLKSWKMNPIRSRRRSDSASSESVEMSVPSIITRPEVGASNPASKCSNVVLPDPDGPTIAVNLPFSNRAVIPATATVSATPEPYVLRTSSASTAAGYASKPLFAPHVSVMSAPSCCVPIVPVIDSRNILSGVSLRGPNRTGYHPHESIHARPAPRYERPGT